MTYRTIVNLILPEKSPVGPDFRKRVEWFMLLRLVVTTLLLGATIFFQLSHSDSLVSYPAIALYVLIGATFFLSFLYAVALPLIPNPWAFSFFQVMVDVVYYSALIHFTGGVSSTFSLIYVFPIIAAGILHFRRGALLTASASCVLFGLMINLEFHGIIGSSEWAWVVPWASRSPGYVLWVMVVDFTVFFLAAFVSSSLAEQLQWTKAVLKVKEIDFRKLSELHWSIVRSIPSGIVTTDAHDRITFINAAGTQLLGASPSELVGVPISEVFPSVKDRLLQSGMRRETFATVNEIQGEKRQLELTVSDLQSEDNAPSGRLVVFHDVTRLKKMEERVRASEQKAALVRVGAGMAHEIRNPLAAVRGAAELLTNYPPQLADANKLLNIIIRESDRLNSLLGDFLMTVSAGGRGQVRVLLDDLVRTTTDQFAKDPRARDRISMKTLLNKGVEVAGDPARLKQLLGNLISNALDASPDGGTILITLDSDKKTDHAVLKVQDSGPGIPEHIRDRVFEPFTTTKTGGKGLGLPVVLSTVEAHGGSVEIETASNQGTVFVVRLPLAGGDTSSVKGGRNHG